MKFQSPKTGGDGTIDPSLIEKLGEIATRLGLSEVAVETGDLKIRVSRQITPTTAAVTVTSPVPLGAEPVVVPAVSAAPDAAAPPAGENPGTIKSPMVGTAYLRPSPSNPAFVEVGTVVKSGDKILLVEAMKTFNEIVAPRGGTVTAIFVSDGQPVEYGQPLLVIE